MNFTGLEVLFYALAAATSVLVLSATLVVIRSRRPRTNGLAFLSGFLIGTVVACILGLAVGQSAVDRLDSHDTLTAVITLLLGIALLVVGVRVRRAPPRSGERGSRSTAILAGLHGVGPAATASMGGLLGFGGPKRLLLTFLGMASATEVGRRDIIDVTWVAIFVVVSSVVVSVPVGVVVLAGDRAEAIFMRGQLWVAKYSNRLQVWLSLGIGALLVADGLLRLLT
jgi:hypothetical protein